jgi:peroxiredoxin
VQLLAYSLGLGLPCLFAALALDQTQSILRRLQRHMHKIELVSGAFLVTIGLLVASGSLQQLSARFGSSELALAATVFEDQVINLLTGQEDAPVPTRSEASTTPVRRPSTAPTAISANVGQNQAAPPPIDLPVNSSPLGIGSISDLVDSGMATIGTQEGNLAPEFETVTDDGQPIRLSDYRGEVVLVNFWATWCGPCLVEMPEFQAAYEQYQDQGFTVVAVNNLESAAAVRAFREENALSFPLAMDESGAIQSLYGVQRTYPSSFLLDRNGVILLRRAGILTPDELHEALRDLLTA